MLRIGYKHHILLIAFHPEIVCLSMSGFSGDVITNQGMLDESVYFIQIRQEINGLHNPNSSP
jgi:hypothetical protein